jgi:hypothetical protein
VQAKWRTPSAGDDQRGAHPNPDAKAGEHSLTTQIWKTPKAAKTGQYQRDRGTKGLERPNLTGQAKNWVTPQTFDSHTFCRTLEKIQETKERGNSAGCVNLREQVHYPEMDHQAAPGTGQASSPDPTNSSTNGKPRASLKLNADWVEALMDVPPMWTDCGCSATESIPPSQPSPTSHSTGS